MQNRVDIKNFVLQIERDFSVNEWKIDGVHLWPILRIRLFFTLIEKLENHQKVSTVGNVVAPVTSIRIRLQKELKRCFNVILYFLWMAKLPQKSTIFVGSDSHRVDHKNRRFNRYFDVMIEEEDLKASSMYFEYASQLENQYNKDLIHKFSKPLKGFLSFKKRTSSLDKSLKGYNDFLSFLQKSELFNNFVIQYKEENLMQWFETRFAQKILFFKKTLSKIKPDQIVILCYYSEDLLALVAAANKLNIETIEMQHGPQTEIHLCYGSWSLVPNEGYDVLPRKFWCWDEYSKDVLEKWISRNELYKVEVKGNPWVNYWKNHKEAYRFRNFVLYTLQPSPLSIEQLFSTQLIQLIKESKCLWFIRLHPRQLDQSSRIKEFLQNENIIDLVNIDNATNDALPLLLNNAKLHITHFSGSALEASYFHLKTVLINETALISFPHLIESSEAIYVDYRDNDFKSKILSLINN